MRGLRGSIAVVCWVAVAGLVVSVAATTASEPRPAATGEAATLDYRYYPRSNYVWPFATGPFYGKVRQMTPREPGVVHTRVGSFRLNGAGPLPFPEELTARNEVGHRGVRYFIVAIHPETAEESREGLLNDIRETGGEVMRYLPVSSMIVRLTQRGFAAVQNAPGLVAIEPYHAAFKLDPSVGRQPALTREAAASEIYDLDINLFRGENAKAAADAIRALGGEVTKILSNRIYANVHYSKLGELANLESVEGIFERQGLVMMGQETSNMMQTGGINFDARPYHDAGVTGTGQILYVIDDGLSLDAADMSNTSTDPGTAGPGHRKVVNYVTTENFGGAGDGQACDAPPQGGFTHGHVVSAAAVGNASFDDRTFVAIDLNGNTWDQVGVAPGGRVAFYDGLITPAIGACGDPMIGLLDVGTLWCDHGQATCTDSPPDGVSGGSLLNAYNTHGARTFVLPFGENVNTYDPFAEQIDEFLNENREAALIVPAGNNGMDADGDGFSDVGTLQKLATAKNAITVGSSGSPDDQGAPGNVNHLERSGFSAVGPAGASGRVSPILMAPGQERGVSGVNAEYACRSSDNDNGGAVICDQVSGKAGTSFAGANAAGAAMLVRDYFALGFYPDGTSTNASNGDDQEPRISGALVTAILINSAEFLGVAYDGMFPTGNENLNFRARFNNEQGYGRIKLDNVLPLSNWAASPTSLLVTDGLDDARHPHNIDDIGLVGFLDATVGGGSKSGREVAGDSSRRTATFEVCDDTQELRVTVAYVEGAGENLVNDINLELIAPSSDGVRGIYHGNYFTDDDDRNGIIDEINEDCPTRFDDGTPNDNGLDRSRFSIETCVRQNETNSPFDSANNTESIVISPNPEERIDALTNEPILRTGMCSSSGDACGYDAQCPSGETCVGGTSQVEAGSWTITVFSPGGGMNPEQHFAVALSGGVCKASSARLDATSYVCNSVAKVVINEVDDASDPAGGLTVAEVASRTTVEVLAADGSTVLDTESGSDLGFAQPDADVLQFVADAVQVTDGTAYQTGNGVLDVKSGNFLRLTYTDEVDGMPAATRVVTSEVNCQTQLLQGRIVVAQFGQNETFFIDGGCERNARGLFEFGFPDKYMDANEQIRYQFGYASIEQEDIEQATLELTCVIADADSPATCKYEDPSTTACPDPTRANNTPCGDLIDILDPIKQLGVLTAGSGLTSHWQVFIGNDAAMAAAGGTPEVDMVMLFTSQASGRSTSYGVVNRHRMNVDEVSKYYSTDFPNGGVENFDRNNNGMLENPTNTGPAGFPTSANTDYVFETKTWSDMTACLDSGGVSAPCNEDIRPWFFDLDNGGFTTGLVAGTSEGAVAETIAQWGEDKNFNDQLDGRCESEPSIACDRFPEHPEVCGTVDFNFNCVNLEDRDPENFPLPLLDQNWSTLGGCGWQTRAPGACAMALSTACYVDEDCGDNGPCSGPAAETGGVWHTGTIGTTTETECMVSGNLPGQCQFYETIGGTTGQLVWFEILTTPIVEKVDKSLDAEGLPLATIEISEFRWNSLVELPDNNVSWTVEVDTDVDALEPVDLKSDFTITNAGYGIATGDYGPVEEVNNPSLTRGWPIFARVNPTTGASENGTVGGNRAGKNACFFEGGAVDASALDRVGLPLPPDDDVPEGFCPSGGGFGGADTNNTSLDATLVYCTPVCSLAGNTPCAVTADCQGTCIDPAGAGFCDNSPTTSCTSNADCNLGTCENTACDGQCVDDGEGGGRCNNNGASCTPGDHTPCEEDCDFSGGTIDQFVTATGPVRTNELNDFNGPDMRFGTLEDIFGDSGDFMRREGRDSAATVVITWRELALRRRGPSSAACRW